MRRPLLRYAVPAAVALTFFTGGLGSGFAVHQHRVAEAVSAAHEVAATVEASRAELELSFARARRAAADAAEVADHEHVARAVDRVSSVTAGATEVARRHRVEIAEPDLTSPLLARPDAPAASDPSLSRPPLPAATSASASPKATPTTSATAPASTAGPSPDPTLDAAAALAEAIADPVVKEVLEGRVDSVAEVEAAIDRMERAARDLEREARRVEGTAASLEQTAANEVLARANLDLDTRLDTLGDSLLGAVDLSGAVEGLVADDAVLATLGAASEALAGALSEEVDRDDAQAVRAHVDRLMALEGDLISAEDAARASHGAWVERENSRRAEENEARRAAHEDRVQQARARRRSELRAAADHQPEGWKGSPEGRAHRNGHVPHHALCRLAFAPESRLDCAAARSLEEADAAFHRDTGAHLQINSAYRSFADQVTTKARKGYLAAPPGTSNHGWGMAVDLRPASAAWLRRHGADYGWVHPLWARPGGSKPESWHLEFVAPDVGPVHVEEPALLEPVSSVLQPTD